MAQAYDFLSEWFETLNDDCDYAQWSQYFINGLSRLGVGKKGLELGCGSGAFCRALQKAGYDMTGADLSEGMLNKATALAREEGLPISFVKLNAARFRTPTRFDFILSPNDCYNYLKKEELHGAFRAAANALKENGIFWFDISSSYKLRQKVGNNLFADDRDEVTYLCFNRLKDDCVEMDVTLFVRNGDGNFTRYDEKHVQYIHEEEALKYALAQAGFTVLCVEGHLGKDKENSDRLNFICKKAKY